MKQKAYRIYFPKVEHQTTSGCHYTYSSYIVPHYFKSKKDAMFYLSQMDIYTHEIGGTMRIWKEDAKIIECEFPTYYNSK